MGKKKALGPLQEANKLESYNWLGANHPAHYDAVFFAVINGATPDQIYSQVVRDTYRLEFAVRCKLAAQHIQSEVENGSI